MACKTVGDTRWLKLLVRQWFQGIVWFFSKPANTVGAASTNRLLKTFLHSEFKWEINWEKKHVGPYSKGALKKLAALNFLDLSVFYLSFFFVVFTCNNAIVVTQNNWCETDLTTSLL